LLQQWLQLHGSYVGDDACSRVPSYGLRRLYSINCTFGYGKITDFGTVSFR
jgi:hypothetical protein